MFDLRSQSVTEKLENAKAIRDCKHDIARVKTVIREVKKYAKKVHTQAYSEFGTKKPGSAQI
jgi:hypothetical protein